MKTEHIDFNKCSKLEQIMLFMMANYSYDDLTEEDFKTGFMSLGEIERYSRFGIDFTKSWIENLMYLEDKSELWKVDEKIQSVAKEVRELKQMLEKYSDKINEHSKKMNIFFLEKSSST